MANGLVFFPSFWTGSFLFFLCLKLYLSRQLKLVVGCFICLVIGFAYFGSVKYSHGDKAQGAREENATSSFEIEVDSIQVDGNMATMIGHDTKNREKLQLRRKLVSREEKTLVKSITDNTVLSGEVAYSLPESRRNLNGFDYRQFLKQQGIYRTGEIQKIQEWKKKSTFSPIKLIKRFRKKCLVFIEEEFQPVTASYMKSLLFGMKDSTFKNQQLSLGKLGILHFFSLSGLHLYFFVETFRYFVLRLGVTQETCHWLEIVFLGVFLVMTGMSTSVGRCVGMLLCKKINSLYSLGFSGLDCWSLALLIGLILNPYLLASASGQLSYGLTFYIFYLQDQQIAYNPSWLSRLRFSIGLSLLSIPIVSFHFFEFNLLGILLTILLSPLFSRIILPILSVEFVLGLVMPMNVLFLGIELFLSGLQSFFHLLSGGSFFHIVTGSLPMGLYLFCLILSIKWLSLSKKWRWSSFCIVSCAILLPFSYKYVSPKGILAFIDVGQGDALLLKMPFHKKAILIDTGGRLEFAVDFWAKRERQVTNSDYTLLPFLKSQGVDVLDGVFVTHGDDDHMGDLVRLSEEVKIKAVYYPLGAENKEGLRQSLIALERKGISLNPILAGVKLELSQKSGFKLLSPSVKNEGENNDSLVFKLDLVGTSFLLTGDLEESGEQALLSRYGPNVLRANVLKVGHHGSRTSSSESFIKGVSPKEAIISCGLDNRFGHPHEEVLGTLTNNNVRVMRTDQLGMVYYQWYSWSKELSEARHVKKSN